MKKQFLLAILSLGAILFVLPLWAANPSEATAASEGEAQVESLTELNKQLANPISSLWSIAFQQNNYMLDMGAGKVTRFEDHLSQLLISSTGTSGKLSGTSFVVERVFQVCEKTGVSCTLAKDR
jgi:hypothetical protein